MRLILLKVHIPVENAQKHTTITKEQPVRVHYLLQDGLGSVRAVADDSAALTQTLDFSPYGVPQGSYGTGFGFTGEYTDANDLLYLRARYYAPEMGVFTALDPWEGTIQRPISLNGYSWVEGDPVMNTDPSGLCAKRTTDSNASSEEITRCRQQALRLCDNFDVELTQNQFNFDDVWTTTRVDNVWEAVLVTTRKLIDSGTYFYRTLSGFEIEIRGGENLAPDKVTRACAQTPNGMKMSLYNCNPDDPWTINNLIHEFGHILIHRAGGDIISNWESIQQKFDEDTNNRILFREPEIGFVIRQNPFLVTFEEYNTYSDEEKLEYVQTRLTEDIADMFLNWVVGGFPGDEVGSRRREFVEGIASSFADGSRIENIGMGEWAVRAVHANRRPCPFASQARLRNAWLASITGDNCLDMVKV